MTAPEMNTLFLIEYDRVAGIDAPGYEPQEISELLSAAQEELVFHVYNPLGNKYHEGLEETELSTVDLQELITEANLTETTGSGAEGVLTNGTFFDLPDNHYLTIMEEATVSSDDCYDGNKILIKPITHDEYLANKDNPYKKPAANEVVWRLSHSSNKFELITDGTFTVGNYTMRYLKKPTPIITEAGITVDGVAGPQDCQLKDTTHRRIVAYAVRKASAITDPSLYKVKAAEQQLSN